MKRLITILTLLISVSASSQLVQRLSGSNSLDSIWGRGFYRFSETPDAPNMTDKKIAVFDSRGIMYKILRDSVGLGIYTADNGLTMTTRNTRLGGTLVIPTTINTDAFLLTISTANAGIQPLFVSAGTGKAFSVLNNSTSNPTATFGNGNTGNGIEILTQGGTGVVSNVIGSGHGFDGIAIDGEGGRFAINPTSTNTVLPILSIRRNTSATAGDGIGGSIDFMPESGGVATLANQIISKWSTVNFATRTSRFIVTGVNSTTTADLLTIEGSGSTRFNKYGIGTFGSSSPAYGLGVDASGNIVEYATTETASGTYTPTLTNATNVTSSTAFTCQYMRVGNVVTVSGRFTITFTTITTVTSLGISLPIASGFTAEEQVGGSGASNKLTSGAFAIRADVTNDRADFYAVAPGTGLTETYWFSFTYYIVPN